MSALGSFFLILALSLVVHRLATTALELTGLPTDVARFQARSAFTGSGFTTAEAELVTTHPVRRKIVMFLMLLGNVGIVSLVASATVSLGSAEGAAEQAMRIGILVLGAVTLLALVSHRRVDRIVCRGISTLLSRWTDLETRTWANVVTLAPEHGISVARVGDSLADLAIGDIAWDQHSLILLGVASSPGQGYTSTPQGDFVLHRGDLIYVYGPAERVADLCQGHEQH